MKSYLKTEISFPLLRSTILCFQGRLGGTKLSMLQWEPWLKKAGGWFDSYTFAISFLFSNAVCLLLYCILYHVFDRFKQYEALNENVVLREPTSQYSSSAGEGFFNLTFFAAFFFQFCLLATLNVSSFS